MGGFMRTHLILGLVYAFSMLSACGLDGIRGELVRIEGNHYLLKAPEGHEFQLHVDSSTHKDAVQPGDDVQAYITEDGHAEFIQRLEKQ